MVLSIMNGQMVLSIVFSKRHQETTRFAMAQAGTHPSVKIDLIQRYGWPWIPARANCHLHLRPCAHFSEGHRTFLKPYMADLFIVLHFYPFTVFPLSLTSGKVLNKTLHFPLTLFFFCFSLMNWSHCLCEILVNMLVWIDSTCRWVLPLHKSQYEYINNLSNVLTKNTSKPPRHPTSLWIQHVSKEKQEDTKGKDDIKRSKIWQSLRIT